MAKSKKFGTFSGVFTPSILTILGVIMYLRFPTIIGQAGLINTIGIIVVAHIISITTSLSVASLSTDKTVKTGGTYFMISRSLGLPIGGTLGWSLFVGLSFSVSLYLIGFAESFLSYWDFDSGINSIRITGTIILLVVTTITFISTSLAIKSQYFIMAAIVLSLISIFFGHHEFSPEKVNLKPMADAAPFMILFGIFFPAVTGFEAGVSMSGDLKDAKKSLPLGAMAAVAVGFLVYIGLAFFYAFTVDAEALRNDSQILFKIALVPSLVSVGIWAATVESTLGSILGAPRILQAIAMDKIAPKAFAKGTGKANEPRNALLLAFAIAEIGILIGELDVIARIVSMFFITTYAFLNLASAIESWSSSDFRPAFKIPRFVSILGAVSAFVVMILLDFVALTGAVVVLGLLFFYLTRKELVLESGDAWSSFWTNLAKKALLKLTREKTNTRNWRPNIVLFSGAENARPYLIELGLVMSGKLGALTNFELICEPKSLSSSKPAKVAKDAKAELNFFKRQFTCSSVESGIKAVTSVYGFSGFEPNTIMMGWSRETNNADFFADILTDCKKKNLNAVFLDYDKKVGFGKKECIDIWWNGKGRHLSFSLNLMRFVLSDKEWRDAVIRILIVNNDNTLTDKLYRNTKSLLVEKRIEAEVKVISDEFGSRNLETIVSSESANTDLVVLGLSQRVNTYTGKYIESVNRISQLPSSILILSPTDEFEEINIVEDIKKVDVVHPENLVIVNQKALPEITSKVLKIRIEKLDDDLHALARLYENKVLRDAISYQIMYIDGIKAFTEQNIQSIERAIKENSGIQLSKSLSKLHQSFLNFSTSFFENKGKEAISNIRTIIDDGIGIFNTKIGNYIYDAPDNIVIQSTNPRTKKEKDVSIPFKSLLVHSFYQNMYPEVSERLALFEQNSFQIYASLKKLILQVNDLYEKRNVKQQLYEIELEKGKAQILNEFKYLNEMLQNELTLGNSNLLNIARSIVVEIADGLQSDNPKKWANTKLKVKNNESIVENLLAFSQDLEYKLILLNNAVYLDCHIHTDQKTMQSIILRQNERMQSTISEKVLVPIDLIIKNIDNSILKLDNALKPIAFTDAVSIKSMFQDTYFKISEFSEKLPSEIDISDISFTNIDENKKGESVISVKVEPYKIARYYIDTLFYEPLYRELEQFDNLIKQVVIECKEANSLIKFRLENENRGIRVDDSSKKELDQFLQSIKKQVVNQRLKVKEAMDRIGYQSDAMLKNALSPLYSHAIIQSGKKISTLLREQKSKKITIGFTVQALKLKEKISTFVVDLVYSSSNGLILAKKYLTKKENARTTIQQIVDVAVSQMPNPKVLTRIPVFYRTLFSSKSLIKDDFWVPREVETTQLIKALQRHKDGYGGAVLITGVHGAGKTTLSRYFSHRYFKKDRIYFVKPPIEGSSSIKTWNATLLNALGGKVDVIEALRDLPYQSVVVINDLELWFERCITGYEVIAEIMNLINVFGRKVFFIINCNIHAFDFINKAFPIQDNFISIIECNPFSSKELQQLIQSRHASSGLSFTYYNHAEEAFSRMRFASLFTGFFNYSDGIPGVAINAWLTSVTKVDKQNIVIQKPELPNCDVLHNLDKDWLIAIALFVQHKNITANKLARLLDGKDDDAIKLLNSLFNAGIVLKVETDVFTLNKFIEPMLVKLCITNGIL